MNLIHKAFNSQIRHLSFDYFCTNTHSKFIHSLVFIAIRVNDEYLISFKVFFDYIVYPTILASISYNISISDFSRFFLNKLNRGLKRNGSSYFLILEVVPVKKFAWYAKGYSSYFSVLPVSRINPS